LGRKDFWDKLAMKTAWPKQQQDMKESKKYLPFLLQAPSHLLLLLSKALVSLLCVQFSSCALRAEPGRAAFLTPRCEAHIALPSCQTSQYFLGQTVRLLRVSFAVCILFLSTACSGEKSKAVV